MNQDQLRLFGAFILIASIAVLMWLLTAMTPLPEAELGDWCAVFALTGSALIGSFLCWRAGA